jgi:hypothetical protein
MSARAFRLRDGHVVAGLGVATARFAIFIAARPPHNCPCCANPDLPACGRDESEPPRPHRLAGSVETLADLLARPEAFREVSQASGPVCESAQTAAPLILADGDRLRLVYPE